DLHGGEVNGLYSLSSSGEGPRLALLAGFRFLEMDEKLAFENTITGFGLAAGNVLNFVDQFDTRNRFYGGQVGVRAEYSVEKLYFKGTAKLALGGMSEMLDVGGASTLTAPGGAPVRTPGGIFAQSSNIGHSSTSEFAIIPEVT